MLKGLKYLVLLLVSFVMIGCEDSSTDSSDLTYRISSLKRSIYNSSNDVWVAVDELNFAYDNKNRGYSIDLVDYNGSGSGRVNFNYDELEYYPSSAKVFSIKSYGTDEVGNLQFSYDGTAVESIDRYDLDIYQGGNNHTNYQYAYENSNLISEIVSYEGGEVDSSLWVYDQNRVDSLKSSEGEYNYLWSDGRIVEFNQVVSYSENPLTKSEFNYSDGRISEVTEYVKSEDQSWIKIAETEYYYTNLGLLKRVRYSSLDSGSNQLIPKSLIEYEYDSETSNSDKLIGVINPKLDHIRTGHISDSWYWLFNQYESLLN